ncbi:hypothetical protein, partial [Agromyces sp. ZXT2-6]|uniref:hypothetical protein n=1 Tax=Agromyces sp. ZXT2-6 TaxID=3461153 RepID=UPI00405533E1
PKPKEEPKPKPKEEPKPKETDTEEPKPKNEFGADGEHVERNDDAVDRESTPSGTKSTTFDDDGDGLPDRWVVDEGGWERHEQIEDRETDTRVRVHDDDGDRQPDRVMWEGEDGQNTTILDDDGDGVPDRTRVIQHRDGTSTVYYDDDLDGDIDRSSQYGPDGEPVDPDDDES